MTLAKQWEKIREIIREDATEQCFYYVPQTSGRCVIGGLAHAAGIQIPISKQHVSKDIDADFPEIRNMAEKLLDAYPVLSMERMVALQQTNDKYDDLTFRRDGLLELCDKWESEDQGAS